MPAATEVLVPSSAEEAASLEMLSGYIGKPVSMQVESSYTQEQFDIVLM